ncbi:MAG: hypothetical protein V1736_08655 [Pseudomonadota bacterium]
MRSIREEIADCISDLKMTEDEILSARFKFPESFIGFQGHFPEKKILPGVCEIQCVLIMLEQWTKRSIVLKEIVLAKFLSAVFLSEELTCLCKYAGETDQDFILKASLSKGGQKIAELKLKICFN